MKGDITGVKNILFKDVQETRAMRNDRLRRVRYAISQLTAIQQQVLTAYYFQELTIPQIARERGVQRSTVSRTLHRAEQNLKKYLY
jgi:RNA polymerase sigma factor (sigma-70 family)